MVLLVPKAYNKIKDEGIAEGEQAERERMLAALREAGVDEETRRRVEDALERSARRNGR